MEKIWLKHYPKGVPAEIDTHLYSSIVELFEHSCKKFADKTALINMGYHMSYAELEYYSGCFAAFLQEHLRLKKGERFAIMLPNVLQFPVAFFGALRAGLIVVSVNPQYTVRELVHQLKDSGATGIIVLANFAHVLTKALAETDIKHVIITELGDLFRFPKKHLVNFAAKYIKKLIPRYKIPNAYTFSTLLKLSQNMTFEPVSLNEQDVALLQYTGGTTGVAKGAELTHYNLLSNVSQCLAWVEPELHEGEEVIVTALPLYHIFALTVCCLAFFRVGFAALLITNPRDISRFVKELSQTRFTIFTGVNTLFNVLNNAVSFPDLDFESLRMTIAGGMAVQQAVADKWQEITGCVITEGYGLTEASPVVTINLLGDSTFRGSIGLPIPSTEVKICDQAGHEVPLGEKGELFVKGPQVMNHYWKKPEETAAVMIDGWLCTGDMVRMDEDGFIYIVDRKKDMIDVSGFNVYPNEVEAVLVSHPGVLEAGVVGVPDAKSGEAVKAFVVKKDPTLNEQALLDYCHENLTAYKIPKYIEFRHDLKKSSIGKVLRRELQEGHHGDGDS